MKKSILLLLSLIAFKSYSQIDTNIYTPKDIEQKIDWINKKFVQYHYEDDNVRQLQSLEKVIRLDGKLYLLGSRTQDTNDYLTYSSRGFLIPLLEVNNFEFIEKKNNYWLIVKMKKNKESIILMDNKDNRTYHDRIDFVLKKTIDKENLKPKIQKYFEDIVDFYIKYEDGMSKAVSMLKAKLEK